MKSLQIPPYWLSIAIQVRKYPAIHDGIVLPTTWKAVLLHGRENAVDDGAVNDFEVQISSGGIPASCRHSRRLRH
jgi:hypothetical protein